MLVAVVHKYDGCYIGEKQKKVPGAIERTEVEILAVTQYPSQKAIIFKDNTYQRYPHKYGSVHKFDSVDITEYTGDIPDYSESVKDSLNKIIAGARGEERFVLKTHLHELENQINDCEEIEIYGCERNTEESEQCGDIRQR